ncbi:hypothetical protein KR200_000401, partial [Drosophila serrata]
QLRELNIIKDTVRASFNIDSSVENSIKAIEKQESFKAKQNSSYSDCLKKNHDRSCSISTPCSKRFNSDLFHCGLSPITGIKLDGFECNNLRNNETEANVKSEIGFKNFLKNGYKDVHEITLNCKNNLVNWPPLALQPGKWRKSLNTWRKTHETKQREISKCITPSGSIKAGKSRSLVTGRMSVCLTDFNEISCDHEQEVLKYCDQLNPLSFHATYSLKRMMDPIKVGEGAYGEVFRCTTPANNYAKHNLDIVLKIIPIEGSMEINGEKQKSFAEILPEIIITKKMSSLQANANNSTDGFVNIHKATLVRGKYPHHLIQLWEKYDSEKNSENDHPRVFAVNQLYLVLELEFAGNDMSNFKFTNAEQSYFVLQQIILSLAIGEEECQFEHRDLHWGNVLIKDTKKKDIYFKFMNNDLTLPSKGVKISIIDYTLSRITIGQSCYFNDLSSDEDLFSATGDYQYDIYRMMRNELKNNWASFSPKTNILWLSYLVSKLLKGVNYKCVNSKIHRQHIKKLKELQNNMLSYDSAATCVKNMFRLT